MEKFRVQLSKIFQCWNRHFWMDDLTPARNQLRTLSCILSPIPIPPISPPPLSPASPPLNPSPNASELIFGKPRDRAPTPGPGPGPRAPNSEPGPGPRTPGQGPGPRPWKAIALTPKILSFGVWGGGGSGASRGGPGPGPWAPGPGPWVPGGRVSCFLFGRPPTLNVELILESPGARS